MPVSITIDRTDYSRIKSALLNVVKNMSKEIGIAAWKAAKKGESIIAKQVGSELATPQKVIKKQIYKQRIGGVAASVQLNKSGRIPLRDFGARQTKKGVSYKISKSTGRRIIPGAFQGPKPGVMKTSWKGNVFKRVGKARLPIRKLWGPSPWGVHVVGDQIPETRAQISERFGEELIERIRYNRLKQSGAI